MSLERNTFTRHRLQAVLVRLGWLKTGGVQGKYELWYPQWALNDDSFTGVLVPLNPKAVDATRLLKEAVHVLRMACDPDQVRLVDTYLSESNSAFDRAEWRAEETPHRGAIYWKEGMLLLQSAQRQLTAAARTVTPAGAGAHNVHAQAILDEFLRTTLMDQTLVGSYIVSAITPRDHVLVQAKGGEVPDTQKLLPDAPTAITNAHVLTAYSTAVSVLKEGITEYRRRLKDEVFAETSKHGVSLELVQALREVVEQVPVTITILQDAGWSRPSAQVSFEQGDAQTLATAEHVLQGRRVTAQSEYSGPVQLLARGKPNRIRLTIELEGKKRTVQAFLTPEQYERAIDAHKAQQPLSVVGDLVEARGQKMPTLVNITSVSIGIRDQERLFGGDV